MKSKEKQLARQYRQKAWSINKIAKKLNVANSSVYEWTKDIDVTIKPNIQNSQKKATLAMQEKYREIRDRAFEEGYKLASKNENFRLLAALYWGEGGKDRNVFDFSNSDVIMLKKVIELLNVFYHDSITLRIHVYLNNGLTKKQIENYWKKLIKVDKYFIYEQSISRASQKTKIGKLPYGTGTIYFGNTEFKQKILGAIKFLGD